MSTIQRRLNDPEFTAEVARTREAMIEKASDGLADAAESAVTTLRDLLKSDSDQIKLGSARAILDSLLKFRESEITAERLRKVEESTNATRRYLETLTGEQIEEFYFELHASLQGRKNADSGP